MENEDATTISHCYRKISQIFLDFMTRITKFEELVNVGNRFLVSFHQGLHFLQRPPIDVNSEVVGQIIKANETKRLSSYIDAGCVNMHDSKQNLSKLCTCHTGLVDCLNQAKSVVKELLSLLDDASTVIQNFNENLPHLEDKVVQCDLDSDVAMPNKKPEIVDYATLMAVIYGRVKQDYNMQERIVSSLSLKSSSAELESYCLMWTLRPFIDDKIMNNAWRYVP